MRLAFGMLAGLARGANFHLHRLASVDELHDLIRLFRNIDTACVPNFLSATRKESEPETGKATTSTPRENPLLCGKILEKSQSKEHRAESPASSATECPSDSSSGVEPERFAEVIDLLPFAKHREGSEKVLYLIRQNDLQGALSELSNLFRKGRGAGRSGWHEFRAAGKLLAKAAEAELPFPLDREITSMIKTQR